MVVKRKKTTIDGMDRQILREILDSRRQLTGNQISKKVGLTPSAIRPRLNNLRSKGIIKPVKTMGMRNFKRSFGENQKLVNIKSPRSIFWDVDLKNGTGKKSPTKRKSSPAQLAALKKGRAKLARTRKGR